MAEASQGALTPVVAFAAAALLLLAVFDLPYGFYGFLRIAVCFSAMLVFARLHKSGHFVLCVIAAGMIILFNPVAPVHLSRENWFWLDLTAAGMFMAAGLWARHELRQPVKD